MVLGSGVSSGLSLSSAPLVSQQPNALRDSSRFAKARQAWVNGEEIAAGSCTGGPDHFSPPAALLVLARALENGTFHIPQEIILLGKSQL